MLVLSHYYKPSRATYTFGTLITSNYCVSETPQLIDLNYLQPIMFDDALPVPGKFIGTASDHPSSPDPTCEEMDDEILNRFDPSGIPPRIAFRSPQARTAMEKEITDLLTPHGRAPPAMVEIDLYDSRYRHLPRVFSTMIAKRKSIDLYKGRLCTRGDLAPLTNVAFVSSPTANRCCVRVLITLAMNLGWGIHALGISQAFLQAENLNEKGRLVITPPPQITHPWTGKTLAVNH